MGDDSDGATILARCLLIVVSLAIESWRAFVWLQTGSWPSLSTADAWYGMNLAAPEFSWAGVQQLADDIMEAPLAAVFFWTGLPLFAIGRVLAP